MQHEHYHDVLQQVLVEEFSIRQPATAKEFIRCVIELKTNIRLYYLDSKMIAEYIWDLFRSNEHCFDVMMRCSSAFLLELQLRSPDSLTVLRKALLTSLTGITHPQSQVADSDVRTKVARTESMETILLHEGWLVFVLYVVNNHRLAVAAIQSSLGVTND